MARKMYRDTTGIIEVEVPYEHSDKTFNRDPMASTGYTLRRDERAHALH
jgi:hypothetical protein